MYEFFSVLDLKALILKFGKMKIWISILYLVCLSCVIWQLYNSFNIFIMKPTTASIALVNSREYPISLTFCKVVYNWDNFDGIFSRNTVSTLKQVFYVNGDHKVDVLPDQVLFYDFIYNLDVPYLWFVTGNLRAFVE